MEEKSNLVLKVDFVIVSRRIRLLAIAIAVGIILIFSLGVISPGLDNPDLRILSIITLLICVILCSFSLYIKKFFIGKINRKNFINSYFNAHVIPFAFCNLGGLLCIITNLFMSINILFAAFGTIISLSCIYLILPKNEDFEKLNF
ncbi:MAG: hypothetical protein FJ216_00740 [Ignavibacteria bacterium]|nr:hypothetical protein [Ignavibacteria bacterium]